MDVRHAVVRRVPRHADARSEVVEVASPGLRLPHHGHVERKRAVAPELCLNAAKQCRDVLVEGSLLQIVSDAEIEGQTGTQLPVVLHISGDRPGRNVRVGRQ